MGAFDGSANFNRPHPSPPPQAGEGAPPYSLRSAFAVLMPARNPRSNASSNTE